MAQAFDPYYKWLGIPPQDQPPNHYRLLALRAFEDDPDVIESAADQRMAHLRTFQGGQYAALSQKLLNEVAGAKVCLLNAQKRARYDQELKAQELKAQQAKAGESAVSAPPAPPSGGGFDLSMIGVGGASGGSVSAIRKKVATGAARAAGPPPVPGTDAVPASNKHMPLIIAGASCLGLLLLIVIVLIFRNGSQASDDTSNVNNVAADDAATKPKPTTVAAPQRDDNLMKALAAFEAAHPPGAPESPLAKGPLGRGLILHMSFEPATIEQRDGRLFVRDLSGNAHHGASASAQLWAQGKVGAGLLCQSPLRISMALLDRQTQFTLVAWVSHPPSLADGAWYSEAGANPIFSFSTGKEVYLRSRGMHSGAMSRMRVPDATTTPDTWNFFSLRGSRTPEGEGRLIIQVNDRVRQIQNDSCVPASIGETLRQTSICNAAGLRIDELMVFDRVLSEAELRTLRARTDPNDGGPVPAVVESPQPVSPAPDASSGNLFKPGSSEPDRPLLLDPAPGATLPNGAKTAALPAEWMFRWTSVPHAQGYEVSVDSPSPEKLKIDSNVVGTSLRMLAHGVAATENCKGWRWKVRAKLDDRWSEWSSERKFDLEPPRDEADVGGGAEAASVKGNIKPGATAPAVKRQPVPDLAAQRKAQELVNDVYSKTIAAARNRDMLISIAQDMVRKANDNPSDAAEQYVLLDRARLLAAEAGGAAAALEIIDQLDKNFDVKPLAMKVETLTICLKKTNLGPEATTEVATATIELMQELARSDNIDAALTLGQLARDHLRKPSDPMVLRKLPVVTRWLHELQAESAKVNSARQKLADNPSDADANTAVGRFECFVRHDFQSGMQHLAKGSDTSLRDIAQAELAVPTLLGDREKLADMWYERAEKETTPASKQAMFFRARYWYEGILGELAGLQRAKVDKRIQRIGQLLGE